MVLPKRVDRELSLMTFAASPLHIKFNDINELTTYSEGR